MENSTNLGPATRAAPVLALTADLMFGARVKSAAEAVGASVRLVRTSPELLSLAHDLSPRLVIIDLDARSLDPVALIRELKADPATAFIPILAYVSHVRADLIDAARLAGVDQVMARGAFARELPNILQDRPAR
jgi:CheY-like chemotaxis protein